MKKVFKFNVETRFASLLIISLLITWCFTSCRDENEIGLEILPPSDTIHTIFSDTATINTVTLPEDSLRTDELSAQLLGSNLDVDGIFGLTTASVYTQVNLEGTPSFGNATTADSLVLILTYSGYYGDTMAGQFLNVFRLNEDMHTDSGYYSNKTFGYDTPSIGWLPYYPRPNTRVALDTINTLAPQIRIKLSQTLADSLVLLDHSNYTSNANWLAYFKGLYLKSTSRINPSGAISYFNFFTSKMTLYFTDNSVNKSYDFSLAGARLNHFDHNYDVGGLPIKTQVADTSISYPINYVQAMAGVKVKISFPFLKHFIDSGNIVINKALLTIKPVPTLPPYSLPSKLLLIIKDENGNNAFPLDYYESTNYYGGDLNSTSDGYTFNIGRQLQQYLDGKVDNTDFYLIVSGSGVVGNRAQILSGTNPDRMKISILYTKIN